MINLVQELLALAEKYGPKIKILVTTEQPPPKRFEQDQDRVLSIWLSTGRKRGVDNKARHSSPCFKLPLHLLCVLRTFPRGHGSAIVKT